jgi:uridine kinase
MNEKSRIVGIAGGSAAGKTSLTKALMQFLKKQTPPQRVEMLSTDAFAQSDQTLGPSFISPSTGEEHFNYNHPDALDCQRLLDTIESHTTAPDAPDVLFVEGLMLLQNPSVREILDLRIFVELEADVRALRRLLRDMAGGRASTDPQFIATYYLESARVGHELYVEPSRVHADLIVRGDGDFSRIVPMLVAAIGQ